MRLALFALAILATLPTPAAAARCSGDELWELATQTLDFGVDEVTVPILSPGQFKAIWYKAEGGPVAVTTVRVVVQDGPTISPNTERVVRTGVWSEPVALSDDAPRVVTSITLRYKSLQNGQAHAAIQIWGQQTVPLPASKC